MKGWWEQCGKKTEEYTMRFEVKLKRFWSNGNETEKKRHTHTEGSIAMTAERGLIKVEMKWKYCTKEKSEYEMSTVNKNDFEKMEEEN